MSTVLAPPYLSDRARRDWAVLQEETRAPAAFDPADADLLPEPARRWVLHAIRPGTPLRRTALLRTHGTIMLGAWRRFTADQVLRPPDGFVWAARVAWPPVHGFDRYRAGQGEMRWRLLNLVSVMSGDGPDITRSAAGRLASEFVMTPAAALDEGVLWKAIDERHAMARIPVDGKDLEVTIGVGSCGNLEGVSVRRWHDSLYDTFEVAVDREATFDGFTIPAEVRASWKSGGEFIRFTVDDALYR
ncbi:DUF6544 family protein [Nonomuraea sp. NPDC050556]|uniref:DUF6544 family protein n=1 Tax=Nonomuraea sp. NPDC050556 TaxID=3364369 RepID=UPI0037AD7EEF